jgi:peptide/nickel transport system permease protein
MSVVELEATEIQLEASTGGLWSDAWHRLIRNPAAIVGALFLLMFLFAAIFAPLIAPYGPKEGNLLLVATGKPPGPSWHHLFGVDLLGRDVFSRILYGARDSLLVGVVSVTIGLTIGLLLGSIAGYIGGWVDSLIMRLMDIMLAIPGLLFAIGLVAMLGPGLKQLMIAIGVVNIPVFARLLRGAILAQRENDFVLAARSSSRTSCRTRFRR